MRIPHILKVALTDCAGIGLIIASIAFGWLPGPGGIPMFLGGLGLLAIHHRWARNLLNRLKTDGARIFDRIFPDHPLVVIAYDVVVIGLTVLSIGILRAYTSRLSTAIGIFLLCLGFGLFLGNRKRLQDISRRLKRFSRKQ